MKEKYELKVNFSQDGQSVDGSQAGSHMQSDMHVVSFAKDLIPNIDRALNEVDLDDQ